MTAVNGLFLSWAASSSIGIDGHAVPEAAMVQQIDRIRHSLADAGIGPGHLLLLDQADPLELIATLLAGWESGTWLLPVNQRWLVGEREQLRDRFAAAAIIGPGGQVVRGASNRLDLDGGGVVLMTSGTTGQPKAAVIQLEALVRSARAAAMHFNVVPGTCWGAPTPLWHIAGIAALVRCVGAGASFRSYRKWDPAIVMGDIQAGKVSHLSLVPTMLLDLVSRTDVAALATLDAILLGGAAASPTLLEQVAQLGLPVRHSYGMTETSAVVAVVNQVLDDFAQPLDGVRFGLESPDDDGVGILRVHSPWLFAGYLDDDLSTDRSVIQDGWFETGDFACLDCTGRVRIVDRRSDLIISGGENIYPSEVENVLCRLPGVMQAAVFGIPDSRLGAVPAALVKSDKKISDKSLEIMYKILAQYKIPEIIFGIDELPAGPGGKVSRAACRALFEQMVADPGPVNRRSWSWHRPEDRA